jgi:hypothetical protein
VRSRFCCGSPNSSSVIIGTPCPGSRNFTTLTVTGESIVFCSVTTYVSVPFTDTTGCTAPIRTFTLAACAGAASTAVTPSASSAPFMPLMSNPSPLRWTSYQF